jgi:hypothetical protein
VETKTATTETPTAEKSNAEIREFVVAHDGYSNCNGNTKCGCQNNMSNACGCSHFDGDQQGQIKQASFSPADPTHWLGPIMMMATIGLVVYALTKTHKLHN